MAPVSPDLPNIPIFHDWGPRPTRPTEVFDGQVWRYNVVPGHSWDGLWTVIDGCTHVQKIGPIDGVWVLGLDLERLCTDPDFSFVRHPLELVKQAGVFHSGITITVPVQPFAFEIETFKIATPQVNPYEREPEDLDAIRAAMRGASEALRERSAPPYWRR